MLQYPFNAAPWQPRESGVGEREMCHVQISVWLLPYYPLPWLMSSWPKWQSALLPGSSQGFWLQPPCLWRCWVCLPQPQYWQHPISISVVPGGLLPLPHASNFQNRGEPSIALAASALLEMLVSGGILYVILTWTHRHRLNALVLMLLCQN